MKIEKWASIAEIVSGAAVAITLVFLVVGIRDSSNTTRSAVCEALVTDLNDFNLAIINNPDLYSLWSDRFELKMADLEDVQIDRLILMNRVAYRVLDAAYWSFTSGTLSPAQWERFRNSVCLGVGRLDPMLWEQTAVIMSDDFVSYAEETCLE